MASRAAWAGPLLACLAAVALGWNAGGYRLLDPDEGRNAEVAREMLVTGDYVVPHLDGLPYLDKPVVYFAAAALAMRVLGPTELAARVPAYLATLATIAVLVWFARRRLGPWPGWVAGVAFATLPLTLAYAHTAVFDSTLAFATTVAILGFFEGRVVLAWTCMAVGALTKGPVALAVPLVTMIPYAAVTGESIRKLFAPRAVAAFGAVALPWFLVVTHHFPEFPGYVFGRETFARFATARFHRTAPFWFYLPILGVGTFPWVVPALGGAARWRALWSERRSENARVSWLLVMWIVGPLAFFTLDQSKLPQYMLPVLPAVALAAARGLERRGPAAGWPLAALAALGLSVTLVVFAHGVFASLPLSAPEWGAITPAARELACVLIAAAALAAWAARAHHVALGALAFALPALCLPVIAAPVLGAVADDRSAAALATAISPALGTDGRVLGVAAYPPSLPFYLRRGVAVATADGHELTSTYLTVFADRYRAVPATPLLVPDAWRSALAHCPVRTVFVVHQGDGARDLRAALSVLPLLASDAHYAAYGPCLPRGAL